MSEEYIDSASNVQKLMLDYLYPYGEFQSGGSVKVTVTNEQEYGRYRETHTLDVVELIAFVYSKIEKGGEV